MDFSIASILMLDGATNGAIYALLGLATVLVFAVTRVIFIPEGEFVAYGALTLAMLDAGRLPGTVALLMVAGIVAFLMDVWSERRVLSLKRLTRHALLCLVLPATVWA